ncbi:MAG: 50S ribosomal protein L9, partial [Blastocatellia bacterium]|nr:50S ribosomal protein L9 [Blastocatellia bacterium]
MAHMDVLLQEDVEHLGRRGEVVKVRAGYGRNYLLPQGLAIKATAGNKRMIEEQRRLLTKRETREHASAQSEAERLDGLRLRFDRRVGEHGILYGSVTVLDIVEALKERGITVERRKVGLHDHIKEVGDYDVVIRLHREVSPTIKVLVRPEGAPDEIESPQAEEAAVAAAIESGADEEKSLPFDEEKSLPFDEE